MQVGWVFKILLTQVWFKIIPLEGVLVPRKSADFADYNSFVNEVNEILEQDDMFRKQSQVSS